MKQALIDWYNAHVVAAWYRSSALWIGILAAVFPHLVDVLQTVLDNIGLVGDALQLSPATKNTIQLILLVVVLPIARAWRQKSMTEAAEKQSAVRADRVDQ